MQTVPLIEIHNDFIIIERVHSLDASHTEIENPRIWHRNTKYLYCIRYMGKRLKRDNCSVKFRITTYFLNPQNLFLKTLSSYTVNNFENRSSSFEDTGVNS
ncbi:hypothetical protein TCAL_15984 [Tigriopus californicus]|uniref:Uncharacterized protein n=1 Tax=Tigriopus californicus TaxID=6832 RepID=A0A553PFP8_TIGCA|nr:hypothetical protein TCAL_15984 [Tigriopus californicus]